MSGLEYLFCGINNEIKIINNSQFVRITRFDFKYRNLKFYFSKMFQKTIKNLVQKIDPEQKPDGSKF